MIAGAIAGLLIFVGFAAFGMAGTRLERAEERLKALEALRDEQFRRIEQLEDQVHRTKQRVDQIDP